MPKPVSAEALIEAVEELASLRGWKGKWAGRYVLLMAAEAVLCSLALRPFEADPLSVHRMR